MMEEKLPITEELIFMKYTDGADEDEDDEGDDQYHHKEIRHGFVFFYPSANVCKIVECNVKSQAVAKDLEQLEDWICKVLFICNEQIPLKVTKNQKVLAR